MPLWVVLSATPRSLSARCSVAGDREDDGDQADPTAADGRRLRRVRGGEHAVLRVANGIPVSTTHTITGAIVGVGSTQRLSAVRWGVARRVVWAWVLTIPGAALVAAITYYIVEPL